MAEGIESDYRLYLHLLPRFDPSLTQRIVIYKASDMQLFLLISQLIKTLTVANQQEIVDLFNIAWTRSNIRFY